MKLEFILKIKIKRNDWMLAYVRKQTIIAFYFEFETVLKFYNLEARSWTDPTQHNYVVHFSLT